MNIDRIETRFFKPYAIDSLAKLRVVSLAQLLQTVPVAEVRGAIINTFKNYDVPLDSKSFQSETKNLKYCHELMQATVCAMSFEDSEVAIIILERYLLSCSGAYRTDLAYPNKNPVSGKLFYEALMFATRLFACKKVKGLYYQKLEHNVLFKDPALLRVLLEFFRDCGEIDHFSYKHVVSRASYVALRAITRSLSREISNENWESCEICFRHVIQCYSSELLCKLIPNQAYKTLFSIACALIERRVIFEVDEEFGGVDCLHAAAVGGAYLSKVLPAAFEDYLFEKLGCSRGLGEMTGTEALKEYTEMLRYLSSLPFEDVPITLLFQRKVELEKHIESCVGFHCPISLGGAVLK